MAEKVINFVNGEGLEISGDGNGNITFKAKSQVDDNITDATNKAPSGRAVKAAITSAKDYTDQKVSAISLPIIYKGTINKESSIPPGNSDLAVGTYYEVLNLDTTQNGYSGRAIWNGTAFDIVVDKMRSADNTTISFRSSDGALQIHPTVLDSINNKVDKHGTDRLITAEEATKLAGISAGAQPNAVSSVNNKTGAIVLTKADLGLGNVNNTSDLNKPISTAMQAALDNCITVIKVNGVPL